ncbi:HIT family protein [Schaalia canis]|uniref:HIT family protein n=1 Tax=Schaalia canis TaxID=100469 RepID=A0A3P1SD05_9ACTO|nr:HIT family protein [Schaalia canis]RRC94847.1 HIT family protein [Schaalia canis]
MSTVFEKIISGEWAGRFCWAEDSCVAFATIAPTAPGHVLVVPREPWAKWTDVPADITARLFEVARMIGSVQEGVFDVPRSGLVIAGFEVPHTHLHVIPLLSEADVALANAAPASDEALDDAMRRLRDGLVAAGYGEFVPEDMSICPPVTH